MIGSDKRDATEEGGKGIKSVKYKDYYIKYNNIKTSVKKKKGFPADVPKW